MSKKSDVIRLLEFIVDILEKESIRYWLDYGTLLGAVRNKGFINNDSDADISIMEEDSERLLALLKERGEPFGFISGLGFQGSGLQLYLGVENRTHIDVFFWHPKGNLLARHWFIPGVDDNKGKNFPSEWVQDLSTVTFEGREYAAPNNPEEMCEFRYGPTWKTPLSVSRFNGTNNPNR